MPRSTTLSLVIAWLALILPSLGCYAETPTDSVLYMPPALRVTDPDLQKMLEHVDLIYGEGVGDLLHRALDIAIARSLRSDKAVLEDTIGRYYILKADFESGKISLLRAEEDALSLDNKVLQAHILAELSQMARTYQVPNESLTLATRAIEVARNSKNFWIVSYCLGELGLAQLANQRPIDAHASLQEAVQIDHLNHYAQEAGHLLWLAWVTTDTTHKFDEAIRLAESSRTLAISQNNYPVFLEATTSLARGYVQSGDLKQGLLLLEEAKGGVDQAGNGLFHDVTSYRRAVAKPLLAAELLEALAFTYQAAKQPTKALLSWKDLYASVSSPAVAAEAARGSADSYTTLGDHTSAAEWFGLEAKAWEKAGNAASTMEALGRQAYAFSQAKQYKDSVSSLQQEESLARKLQDRSRQFVSLLAIAEDYKSLGEKRECYETLRSTESLLSNDLTLAGISPNLVTELYDMLANSYADSHDELDQTVALEKETVPISNNGSREQMAALAGDIESHLAALRVQQLASDFYRERDLPKALLYFELLQHYEMFKAKASGIAYNTHLDDPIITQLLAVVGQIEARPDAAEILEKNQSSLGPVASGTLFSTEIFLTNYYATHNESAKAISAALTIWPYLHIKAEDKPLRHDVQVACQLTLELQAQKNTASTEKAKACLEAAKAFADPDLLLSAHLIYLEVMRTASNGEDTTESDTYLRHHPIRNPQLLLALADSQASRGQWQEEIETLTRTIPLFEAANDFHSLALVHGRIAGAISVGGKQDNPEERDHLLKALDFNRRAADTNGEIEADLALAAFYTRAKSWDKAQEQIKQALALSRKQHLPDLEAAALSTGGQTLRASGRAREARQAFHQAAAIYESRANSAKESAELRNEASVLNGELNSADEAYDLAERALSLGRKSGEWDQIFWSGILLGFVEAHRGDYQNSIDSFRGAKTAALGAKSPLSVAQASLDLAEFLVDVGAWQEALTLTTESIPTFKQYGDKNSQGAAYVTLMDIYGGRESDLKDFGKAMEYYGQAKAFIEPSDHSNAASLSLALFEVHFQEGRYAEAIADAEGPLSYFKEQNDELGEANALLSLAEAKRSAGDLKASAQALALAQPLVTKVADFYMSGRFYYGQANQSRGEGKLTEAVTQYERVLDFLERVKSASSTHSRETIAATYDYIYGELIDTYYALSTSSNGSQEAYAAEAFNAAELNKARNFTHTWGSSFIDALRHKLTSSQIEKEDELNDKEASLQSKLDHPSTESASVRKPEIEKALQQVRAEQSDLVLELRRSDSVYAEIRYPTSHSTSDLPLRPGEVLIEFKMFDPALFVWEIVGTESGSKINSFYKVERSRKWFEDRITAIRAAMNRGTPEAFDPALSEDLFKAIFPAQHAKLLEEAKAIIFVPDDLLFSIPMELLSPTATRNEYILIGKPTSYFPSAAAFRLSRSIGHARREWAVSMLGVADPVTSKDDPRFEMSDLAAWLHPKGEVAGAEPTDQIQEDSTRTAMLSTRGYYFNRLPETSTEINNIAALFERKNMKTVIRVGMDATKAELLKTDLGQYRFLHFATHGFLPVEPGVLEPALILSYDGTSERNMMLTSSEVLSLNLHTDMVVLSACNTGSGIIHRAESVASLGTAFLAAGSASVAVSLWKVSDKSTSLFMQAFYLNLLDGMPKSEALAKARTGLAEKGYRNPFFWAPFVLSGE